ncbi:MAG: hypothetical protein JXQ66_01235, partial [Campylobacterales bacterium]|nr:hypothetical protein [Campylobacterales bacterium]
MLLIDITPFLLYFLYRYFTTENYEKLIIPAVYIFGLSGAFYFSSVEIFKYIPPFVSLVMLLTVIDAYDKGNKEVYFIKNLDISWIFIFGFNTIIFLYLTNFASNYMWALYSSLGWYIYFYII